MCSDSGSPQCNHLSTGTASPGGAVHQPHLYRHVQRGQRDPRERLRRAERRSGTRYASATKAPQMATETTLPVNVAGPATAHTSTTKETTTTKAEKTWKDLSRHSHGDAR